MLDDRDTFPADDPTSFPKSLLAGVVKVHVTDGALFNATLSLTGCSGGSTIRCRSGDGTVLASVVPTHQDPREFYFSVVGKRLGSTTTGPLQPVGPVNAVVMQAGGVTRSGQIGGTAPPSGACDERGSLSLFCHWP